MRKILVFNTVIHHTNSVINFLNCYVQQYTINKNIIYNMRKYKPFFYNEGDRGFIERLYMMYLELIFFFKNTYTAYN